MTHHLGFILSAVRSLLRLQRRKQWHFIHSLKAELWTRCEDELLVSGVGVVPGGRPHPDSR